MKVLDEVITGLDICKNFSYCTHPQKGECPYLYEDNTCDQDGLYRDALHYLKEYQRWQDIMEETPSYYDFVKMENSWKEQKEEDLHGGI